MRQPVLSPSPLLVRRLSLSVLTVAASFWACSLAVFGLMLMSQGIAEWISTMTKLGVGVWRALGLALFTGGQFVFMFMVADRMFPRAGRRLAVWCCELAMIGIGVGAFMVALSMAVFG
ncbi:MAG: hypothetical protein ACTS22_02965 [Phycisphaerales bacterium]